MTNETWLFGYGSIMWKTGFNFEANELCHVDGWARRFWQASTDHRGTPEFPGRVVTLIESAGDRCWGTAYRLPAGEATDIIEDLDYREKGGYDKTEVLLTFSDGRTVTGITYIAHPHNPDYLGESPLEDIARQISFSTGPSGSNKEYILQLHRTLEQHNIQDTHVETLAQLIERATESTL
jgi:glutathione-specific gamma-glutamylcyclotransferase